MKQLKLNDLTKFLTEDRKEKKKKELSMCSPIELK